MECFELDSERLFWFLLDATAVDSWGASGMIIWSVCILADALISIIDTWRGSQRAKYVRVRLSSQEQTWRAPYEESPEPFFRWPSIIQWVCCGSKRGNHTLLSSKQVLSHNKTLNQTSLPLKWPSEAWLGVPDDPEQLLRLIVNPSSYFADVEWS